RRRAAFSGDSPSAPRSSSPSGSPWIEGCSSASRSGRSTSRVRSVGWRIRRRKAASRDEEREGDGRTAPALGTRDARAPRNDPRDPQARARRDRAATEGSNAVREKSSRLDGFRRPTQRRIVVTGGPGGGKTTAADMFRREMGPALVVVPEAATILFAGGFP